MRRRNFIRACGLSVGAASLSGWLPTLARAAGDAQRPKACIVLWMTGGPSHLDTFDLKPDARAEVRGEFAPIATAAPGIQISEHFPRFARLVEHAAILARPLEEARRIAGFVGAGLDVQAMAAAVDPALYRNRAAAPGGAAD